MKDFLRDQRSAVIVDYARVVSLFALAVIGIGILFGFGAVELYETAEGWVLQA